MERTRTYLLCKKAAGFLFPTGTALIPPSWIILIAYFRYGTRLWDEELSDFGMPCGPGFHDGDPLWGSGCLRRRRRRRAEPGFADRSHSGHSAWSSADAHASAHCPRYAGTQSAWQPRPDSRRWSQLYAADGPRGRHQCRRHRDHAVTKKNRPGTNFRPGLGKRFVWIKTIRLEFPAQIDLDALLRLFTYEIERGRSRGAG
jgi:hypothetical protein